MQRTDVKQMLPARTLLGPGPSDVDPRILRAMSIPLLGHLDPKFLEVMDECMEHLRTVFGTGNRLTIPISGTGSSGMECSLVNFIEPGDRVVVGVNGVFGERMCDIVNRCGGELVRVEAEWGKIIEPDAVREAIRRHDPALVYMVHAETSTGIWQPLKEIGKMVRESGALFGIDAVTSLGGIPVNLDENLVDIAYSGTQKCLSCPPGLAPLSVNGRAEKKLTSRRHKVPSWYLDLTMIQEYWGQERNYHHTAPISMIYALHEALSIVCEEGLEDRYARHRRNSEALVAGLRAMGFSTFADEEHRLPVLNAVVIPSAIDGPRVRSRLLGEYNIEIGGGLGDLAGKIWRIGLMGTSSTRKNVYSLLGALEELLADEGFEPPESGLERAREVYNSG